MAMRSLRSILHRWARLPARKQETSFIAHSEKHDSLELVFEQHGEPCNLLEQDLQGDDFGIRIVEGVTESLNYQYLDHHNRVTATLA